MNVWKLSLCSMMFALIIPLPALAFDRTDAELAMTEAGAAVESAERADAAQYASADLGDAQAMLADARTAFDHRHWTDVIMDSESAKVDAHLAAAHSRQQIAEAMTGELEQTVRSLREQLHTGDQP